MHAAGHDPFRYHADFAVGERVCEINRATLGRRSSLPGSGRAEWDILRGIESDRRFPTPPINRAEVARAELAPISGLLTPFPGIKSARAMSIDGGIPIGRRFLSGFEGRAGMWTFECR